MVVSNNRDSAALKFAESQGIPFRHISAATEGSELAADVAICQAMEESGVEWIVLSGYLRKLGSLTIDRYQGRILNIHPALLPRFGGKGMYGRRVHEAVISAGESISGMTVHIVEGEYDSGPILAQCQVPVILSDTPDTLQQRIVHAEPRFFVEVLRSLAENRLAIHATKKR